MRTQWILSALALCMAGCRPAPSPNASPTTGSKVFRIGYQKGGALHLLRIQGELDRRLARDGVRVEWVQFPSAPPMLEAIAVGSLDLGSGADAPVVFAQAAGYPIVLVANTPPGDDNSRAILSRTGSSIKRIEDLRGKKIAISKGTGTHSFLIQALDRVGIGYKDIKPVYLAPPDARAAFDAGQVDAWAAWDPFLTVARRSTGVRTLANGAGIVTAGAFYYSTKAFTKAQPQWIKALLEEVDTKGIWLWQHPRDAALVLAPELGIDIDTAEAINRNTIRATQYVGFRPIDTEVIRAQQTIADTFFRIGLLPKKVDVRETVLTPAEYAAFLPSPQKVASK